MIDNPALSSAPHLNLYLPGIFGIHPQVRARNRGAAALETLLARAEPVAPDFPQGYEEGLFALFGLTREDNADLPVAAVTRMLDMGVIDNDWWLRADPVHLLVERDRLILADAQKLELTQDEANRLVAEIMEVFAADGWVLKAPHPQRWYLKPPRPPELTTTALTQVIGRDVHGFLPRGPDNKTWHTILNEIQILLHATTVNAEREREGRLPVNSLWFWGSGRLPRLKPPPWRRVSSREPLGLALAKLSGTPSTLLPEDYATWRTQPDASGAQLLVLDRALGAALYADEPQWREALEKLDQQWLQPLLRDLKAGAVERVTVRTDAGAGFTLSAREARRWWRRRRPLSAYVPAGQA